MQNLKVYLVWPPITVRDSTSCHCFTGHTSHRAFAFFAHEFLPFRSITFSFTLAKPYILVLYFDNFIILL